MFLRVNAEDLLATAYRQNPKTSSWTYNFQKRFQRGF